jgi:hypothetical protein
MRSVSALRWLLFLACLTASPAWAQSPPPSASPPPADSSAPLALSEAAIPPGQEALLADMLGKGASLPGGCAWTGASIDRTRVAATYGCSAGKASLELVHPSRAQGAGGARTAKFAVIPKDGPPPAELVEAVAARIREREAGFRWAEVQPPPSDADRRRMWTFAAELAAVVAAAVGLSSLWRRSRRKSEKAGEAPKARGAAVTIGASIGASLAFAAAIHGALRALGWAASSGLDREAKGGAVLGALAMVGCVFAASIAIAVLSRLPARVPAWARVLVVTALYFSAGYNLSFGAHEELPRFGELTTMPPSRTSEEPFRGRPRATYRTNAMGFREPEWKLVKSEGTRRIALIGDSYVFGIGVDLADTLAAKLDAEMKKRHPDRAIEIVNLGIPGDNIASHVDAYIATAGMTQPDVVVICLTLPNDLSRWDAQVERRDSRQRSLFSFARFALGDAAAVVWDTALLERGTTEEGLGHFDREMNRLVRMRAAGEQQPRLALFAYRTPDPPIADRLAKIPSALFISPGETTEADFIPGDGHPTGAGNAHFAAQIAAALDADPAMHELLSTKPNPPPQFPPVAGWPPPPPWLPAAPTEQPPMFDPPQQ